MVPCSDGKSTGSSYMDHLTEKAVFYKENNTGEYIEKAQGVTQSDMLLLAPEDQLITPIVSMI